MWSGHEMTGWGWLMMSLAILAWLVVMGIAFWLVSRAGRGSDDFVRGSPTGRPTDPLLILDARLARGEITVEEHRRLREALGHRLDEGPPA